jgi:hypothetical protein
MSKQPGTEQNRQNAVSGGSTEGTEQKWSNISARRRDPGPLPNRQTAKTIAMRRRRGHRILSTFAPRQECQRCLLVIVNGQQLIKSGKLKDLPHSRLRTQEDRFGPTAIQRLSNVKSIRSPKEARKVTSDMSKRSGFALGTVWLVKLNSISPLQQCLAALGGLGRSFGPTDF